jgi:hypothetical protein
LDLQVTHQSLYQSKRTLRAKQAEALDAIEGKRVFALRMDLRTGKTKVVVDDFGRIVVEGTVLDMLVVAPGGSLPWDLSSDLPDDLMARTRVFPWNSGKARGKGAKGELRAFLEWSGPRVLVVNVEAISSVEACRNLCVEFLSSRPGRNVMVVDESVCIKSITSKCAKFCVETLGPMATYRRIMTGLISPRSPLDLFYQFKFLDWKILGHERFVTFRSRYAKVKQVCMLPISEIRSRFRRLLGIDGVLTNSELVGKVRAVDPELNVEGMTRGELLEFLRVAAEGMGRDDAIEAISRLGGYIQTIPVIEGYENLPELHEKIEPHSFRCLLEDCYDMPRSDYSFRNVEMTREQSRIYSELREFATAQLSETAHVTATHVIVQMLRLHQVLCGHTVDENGNSHDIPENRTSSILDLLRDYGGKAIVWCSYDADVRKVSAALIGEYGEGSTARFWGGNRGTRIDEEEEFKTNPACRWMVGTPDAGGYGRDWSVADLMVYYSSRNDLDHRMQSEGRAKADGKTRPIAYVDLRVPGTVDEKFIAALREKKDLSAIINGDDWKSWIV